MLLEKNGQFNSSKCTKHMNVHYFFVMDKIKNGKVVLKHCGTDSMIADYFTKPLQGKKFIEFCDKIMGVE